MGREGRPTKSGRSPRPTIAGARNAAGRACVCCNGLDMADPLQLRMLRKDVDEWNRWRGRNPNLRVDLRGADLSDCDLRLANLRDADLRDATLIMANLTGADLRGADLRNAVGVGARMIGADISDTDLRGADIRTAEDLTPEQLLQTRGDEGTVLPDHMEHPDHWRK